MKENDVLRIDDVNAECAVRGAGDVGGIKMRLSRTLTQECDKRTRNLHKQTESGCLKVLVRISHDVRGTNKDLLFPLRWNAKMITLWRTNESGLHPRSTPVYDVIV